MKQIRIDHLMETSGVKFGTSGARGLVEAMTDKVCYSYTAAFLQHLRQLGELDEGSTVGIAGDLRPSTERIMTACAAAITDQGYGLLNCGRIASPAIACYGLERGIPTLMVTGSHIPDDRNGIKFNKADGEILKEDEEGIKKQRITFPDGRFDTNGSLVAPLPLPLPRQDASRHYLQRYTDFFPERCLAGTRIGLYEHSSVVRDALHDTLAALGATVTRLGRTNAFTPVDTEAIRPEDIALARQWAATHDFDCIVSADGDGDRPLISDELGNWLRGDVAGILCARYLGAGIVATPVSSNSAVEKCGYFKRVIRTRIGSPYVVAAMNEALASATTPVVGYEANGGFLTGSDIQQGTRTLKALPTRDAIIVILATILLARQQSCTIAKLLKQLPQRFTASDRIKEFPTESSRSRLAWLYPEDRELANSRIFTLFGKDFGKVSGIDDTDGLHITFESGDVVHLRPSGNAPELRCYNEASSPERAEAMLRTCMSILSGWKADC